MKTPMRKALRISFAGCLLVLLPACGSDTTAAEDVSVNGSWTTAVPANGCLGNTSSQTPCTMTWILAQSGSTVTGSGALTHLTAGSIGTMTISGTVSSNNAVALSLAGSAFDADPDKTVQFAGTKTDASTISGTFSSTGSITGAFTFKKQ